MAPLPAAASRRIGMAGSAPSNDVTFSRGSRPTLAKPPFLTRGLDGLLVSTAPRTTPPFASSAASTSSGSGTRSAKRAASSSLESSPQLGNTRAGAVRSGSANTTSIATTRAPASRSFASICATVVRGHGHWPSARQRFIVDVDDLDRHRLVFARRHALILIEHERAQIARASADRTIAAPARWRAPAKPTQVAAICPSRSDNSSKRTGMTIRQLT